MILKGKCWQLYQAGASIASHTNVIRQLGTADNNDNWRQVSEMYFSYKHSSGKTLGLVSWKTLHIFDYLILRKSIIQGSVLGFCLGIMKHWVFKGTLSKFYLFLTVQLCVWLSQLPKLKCQGYVLSNFPCLIGKGSPCEHSTQCPCCGCITSIILKTHVVCYKTKKRHVCFQHPFK